MKVKDQVKPAIAQLHHLADLYGVKTSYLDMDKEVRPAPAESLLAVLKALGAPLNSFNDVPSAIREKRLARWRQLVEPVTVVWDDNTLSLNLHIPERFVKTAISGELAMENGDRRQLTWSADQTCITNSTVVEGAQYLALSLYLPEKLPLGYHRLHLETPGHASDTLIISSPVLAYSPQIRNEKLWGVFLPLYSLRTQANWGSGSYSDMEILTDWINRSGGRMIGALPLLALFFDKKYGPGPYMPASRFFWNEFYVDVTCIPDLERCPEAKDLICSTDFQNTITTLRNARQVKYDQLLAIKRKVLEKLAARFFSAKTPRLTEFEEFVKEHPHVEDYARFRAAGDKRGICWYDWPEPMRSGVLEDEDYPEQNKLYYLYTQWVCHEQIQNLSSKLKQNNSYLYMDLPVGVHPYSYDTWRYRSSFIQGIKGGAPPDPVFTNGQNWGFAPLHPEKMRRQGYDYIIKGFQHQLKYANMLRIDHMMGLHRLFWIPESMENRDGVYVNYPAEELYAILTLESNRSRTLLIGEDLGMVPPEVRPMMDKHGIYRMFVGQYQLITENQLGQIPAQSVASLNTHDMFPFASFWNEDDISKRVKLKLLSETGAHKELEQRRNVKRALISILQYKGLYNDVSHETEDILRAILKLLAESPAYALLINLEDLWSETRPQNVPGTLRTQNWSRKARYSWEEFSKSQRIVPILQEIDRIRKSA